jgi:hypothetical protein
MPQPPTWYTRSSAAQAPPNTPVLHTAALPRRLAGTAQPGAAVGEPTQRTTTTGRSVHPPQPRDRQHPGHLYGRRDMPSCSRSRCVIGPGLGLGAQSRSGRIRGRLIVAGSPRMTGSSARGRARQVSGSAPILDHGRRVAVLPRVRRSLCCMAQDHRLTTGVRGRQRRDGRRDAKSGAVAGPRFLCQDFQRAGRLRL